MKTILVTGASGYLGSRLIRVFDPDKYRLLILRRSTTKLDRIADLVDQVEFVDRESRTIDDLFAEERIDTVLHCATTYSTTPGETGAVIASNLSLPLQLLETGCRHHLTTFINIDTVIDNCHSSYSLSKRQFREWLQFYAPQLTAINFSLANFYGPHDDPDKFVAGILQALLTGADHIDLTSGEQKRDFIFIDDVLTAFGTVLNKSADLGSEYHPFEVGTGDLISIRDFVERLKQASGNTSTELRFGAVAQRTCEVMEPAVDLHAMERLGWKARCSLAEGITKTIAEEKKARHQ